MIKFLYALLALFIVFSCRVKTLPVENIETSGFSEFFILPRNIKFLPASDGGVLQYCEYRFKSEDYMRRSNIVNLSEASFRIESMDSSSSFITEYFYTHYNSNFFSFLKKEIKSGTKIKRKIGVSRIVGICNHDTLMIDDDFDVSLNGVVYEFDSVFLMKLFDTLNVPECIRENWINDVPVFDMNITDYFIPVSP